MELMQLTGSDGCESLWRVLSACKCQIFFTKGKKDKMFSEDLYAKHSKKIDIIFTRRTNIITTLMYR